MDVPTRKTFIYDKLFSRIRVVSEPEDHKTEKSAEELYDIYEKTDGLVNLNYIAAHLKSIVTEEPENFRLMYNQVESIQKALSEFCTDLAKNSTIGNIDLTKTPDKQFDKLARIFEKNHKGILVISSPSYFF